MERERLEAEILQVLAARDGDGGKYFVAALPDYIKKAVGPISHPAPGARSQSAVVTDQEISAALWALMNRGLVFLDLAYAMRLEMKLGSCCWRLTPAGEAAAADVETNPDNAHSYLRRLRAAAPGCGDLVFRYADEALRAYGAQCYLSTAVMFGVAAEAAFDELADAFASWLHGPERERFAKEIKGEPLLRRLLAFQRRIEPKRDQLPRPLAETLALDLLAVQDLIRVTRNDAGHPKADAIQRDSAFQLLQLGVRYLGKLDALRDFFVKNTHPE